MADLAHLEKMGRELKCPICLSLFKSAVSLGCNHVFCNLCVSELMKSVSDCPVCKVPFRRREVRPAPHMDNLVSIYKSMEVASGCNIFTTQVAPSTKNSGGPTRVEDEKSSVTPETVMPRRGKSKMKGLTKKKQIELEKANAKTSESRPSTTPSFPAKKRIHVTPYPVSETPLRPEKVSKSGNPSIGCEVNTGLDMKAGDGSKGSLSVLRGKVDPDEQRNVLFSPFFWLREEEEDDEGSQKPSAQLTADTPPPNNAPCFSDIKDSDDETFIKMTPSNKHIAAEAFDSEMFDWTQRACSPELCTTPSKFQTADRHRLDRIQEKGCHVESSKASQSNENAKAAGARKRAPKKKKGPHRKIQRKHVQESNSRTNNTALDEVLPEVPIDSKEIAENSSPENEDSENEKAPGPGRKNSIRDTTSTSHYQRKNGKRSMNQINDTATAEASEQLLTKSSKAEKEKQEKMDTGMVLRLLPMLSCLQTKNERTLDVGNKTSKCGMKTNIHSRRKCIKTSSSDVTSDVTSKALEIPVDPFNEAENQNPENQKRDLNSLLCEQDGNDKHPNYGNGRSKRFKGISLQLQKEVGELKVHKGMKNQSDDVTRVKGTDKKPLARMETNESVTNRRTTKLQQESESAPAKSSANTRELLPIALDKTLRKCENIPQIQCAFCHSSNDTKVSGEMMHYFNGKPVTADYNGRINVVHSHKHCTEWAPNVYFEDDLAINLTAELVRSRRIKCICCGIKGAALGCYEKSCRKSFHFTCAKLIPECRWDKDNFVMICPLHSSSKLPNEVSEPQKQSRKRFPPRGELQAQSTLKSGHDMSKMWAWSFGSPCKWVFCCSALTVEEKEIVSEFSSLTGILISKNWSSTVTHVIASIDEIGACRRTLKFMMGIMEGKWILSIDWIKACMKAMEPVDEEKYEIRVDVHGVSDGPRLGRLRATNKQPKLFNGLRFYFTGDFMSSYKGYLQDLVLAAGGIVLQRKPISRDQEKLLDDSSKSESFIIYSLECPEKHTSSGNAAIFAHRRAEAQALADASGAKVASNTWILDSIAACKLQPLT